MVIVIEDIIVNGLIEKNKINDSRYITESEVVKYYEELVPYFEDACMVNLVSFNNLHIDAFFELYSNYFYKEVDSNNEIYFKLKDDIDIDEFTAIFRNDISNKVLAIYGNDDVLVDTFGKNKRTEFKKYSLMNQ